MRENKISLRDAPDLYEDNQASEVSKDSAQRGTHRVVISDTLQIFSWENDYSNYEAKSIQTALAPSLIQLQERSSDAVTLLRLLCFCSPERIHLSIFRQVSDVIQCEQPEESTITDDLDHGSDGTPVASHKHSALTESKLEVDTILTTARDLLRREIRINKAIQEARRLSLLACLWENGDRIIRIHDLVHRLLRSSLMSQAQRMH